MKTTSAAPRREFTKVVALAVILALALSRPAQSDQKLTPLQVAYAGSMGSMMDGAMRPAIAQALGAEFRAARRVQPASPK